MSRYLMQRHCQPVTLFVHYCSRFLWSGKMLYFNHEFVRDITYPSFIYCGKSRHSISRVHQVQMCFCVSISCVYFTSIWFCESSNFFYFFLFINVFDFVKLDYFFRKKIVKVNAPKIENNCSLWNSSFFQWKESFICLFIYLFCYLFIYFIYLFISLFFYNLCLFSRNLIRAKLKEFGDSQNQILTILKFEQSQRYTRVKLKLFKTHSYIAYSTDTMSHFFPNMQKKDMQHISKIHD